MNLLNKTFFLAALSATAVMAETGFTRRQLQGTDITAITDALCTACDVCVAAGSLCQVNELVKLTCTNCKLFNVEGLCESCDICTGLGNACNPQEIKDLGCGLCDLDVPDIGGNTCFSEVASVTVMGRDSAPPTTTAMKDLKIGDKVLTMDGTYQPVYAFGHYHTTKSARFFRIYNEQSNRPLEITGDHLVYLHGKSSPVPAQTIQVGDVLRTANVGSRVSKVSTVERRGIYAPLTTGGNLVVDGVVASSYIFLGTEAKGNDHDLIHTALAPYRLLCNGVSKTFCDTRYHFDDGLPVYANFGLTLLKWLFNSNVVVKTVGLSILLGVTGACRLFEGIFGASLLPLVLFLVAMVFVSKKENQRIKAKVM